MLNIVIFPRGSSFYHLRLIKVSSPSQMSFTLNVDTATRQRNGDVGHGWPFRLLGTRPQKPRAQGL